MTTKLEQAAQELLEAMRCKSLRVIAQKEAALREALAEPVRKCDGLLCNDCGEYKQKYKDLPGLTEKDLCVCEQAEHEPVLWGDDKFAPHERPVKQEPVACYPCEIVEADFSENTVTVRMITDSYKVSAGTKFLCDAAPQKREWVDLTLMQIRDCCGGDLSHGVSVHAAITAFKEANK